MNILLLHQYYLEKDDGGGSRWNEMTKVWASEGHEITVIAGMAHYTSGKKPARYKNRFVFREEYQPGIKMIRTYVSGLYNVNFIGRLWGYFSFVVSSLYAGIFKTKGKFDLILATSPPLFIGISGYLISRIKRVPLVFEVRDLWPESAIDTGIITSRFLINISFWLERFIYRKASLINVLTPAFKQNLINKKGVPADKIILIPNASDFSLADKIQHNFDAVQFRVDNEFDNKLTLIYVGAHGVANNLIQIVYAAEALKNEAVLFLLIGDGMEKHMLEEEARKRNLTNIRFLGSVSKAEVFKYILASDVGLSVLKKTDAFKTVYSNKTFDYMSCKIPTLMLIDGVSRELIETADAGFYVEPENTDEFVAKIKIYLQDKELAKTHGKNGYHYAKSHFDRQVLATKFSKALSNLNYSI